MASAEPPKGRKTSAYFAFCKQHREQVKTRLRDGGLSTSAPAIVKVLSDIWRTLSDDEKQKYKDPPYVSSIESLPLLSACSDEPQGSNVVTQGEINSPTGVGIRGDAGGSCETDIAPPDAAEAVPVDDPAADRYEAVTGIQRTGSCEADCSKEKEAGDELSENGAIVFPIARVKRIIKLDKDIRVVAADASNLIALASQLFLEHLATMAHASAIKRKRKTISVEDVKSAVKSEPRTGEFLAEALNDILCHGQQDISESEDDAENGYAQANDQVKKKAKVAKKPLQEVSSGTRKIADFFSNSNHCKS
ncbi:hypothetical protein KP509_21G085100 [Ceratopteris richardii]|uniref:HMG box domain-containing protein n=1 Tax=Ceratopteris richardii TaxID=49495 RepID=A0A8T2SC08_CERRI|nr:hypothetical protein KP509_21G085100 [Ceratopteris richardii]